MLSSQALRFLEIGTSSVLELVSRGAMKHLSLEGSWERSFRALTKVPIVRTMHGVTGEGPVTGSGSETL